MAERHRGKLRREQEARREKIIGREGGRKAGRQKKNLSWQEKVEGERERMKTQMTEYSGQCTVGSVCLSEQDSEDKVGTV